MNSPRGINNRTPSGINEDSPSTPSTISTGTQYTIAAVTLAAAIGNIWVMKNRKNFKFRFFKEKTSAYSEGSGNSNRSEHYHQSHRRQYHQQGQRSRSDGRKTWNTNEFYSRKSSHSIPIDLAESMEILELSMKKLPTQDEIKNAYRNIAMVSIHSPGCVHTISYP